MDNLSALPDCLAILFYVICVFVRAFWRQITIHTYNHRYFSSVVTKRLAGGIIKQERRPALLSYETGRTMHSLRVFNRASR